MFKPIKGRAGGLAEHILETVLVFGGGCRSAHRDPLKWSGLISGFRAALLFLDYDCFHCDIEEVNYMSTFNTLQVVHRYLSEITRSSKCSFVASLLKVAFVMCLLEKNKVQGYY